MAVSAETRAWVLDLFVGLGGVTARAMMGGLTLHSDGAVFAIVGGDDRVFVRASGRLAEALAAEGSEQFVYGKPGQKPGRMGYWSLPDAAIDDPEAACDWARRSLSDR